jgi:hypothetical protein
MIAWRCDLCGHVWLARGPDIPALCARCRRRRWNTGTWDGKVKLDDQEGQKLADIDGGELRIVLVEGVGMVVVRVGTSVGDHQPARVSKGKKAAALDGHPSVAAGDYERMASLWLQFLRPLSPSRRLGVLVKFFMLLPPGYCRDAMWSVTSPRVSKPGVEPITPERTAEVIAELWSEVLSPLDEAGRLNAFGIFLHSIEHRHWPLLAKALEEAQARKAGANE